jgi:Ca-activated chloride channel homolog
MPFKTPDYRMTNKKIISVFAALLMSLFITAQSARELLYEANKLYKKKEFDKAIEKYRACLEKDVQNHIARFNLGNALFKQQEFEQAQKAWEQAASNTTDAAEQARSLYNKGVALAKQQKLEEAIDAFKASLKKDPHDADCRYNLARALSELKKKQQQPPPPKPKNQKDPQQKQQPKKEEQPKPQKSKLNKQQVQQVLQMIRRKEKRVQQKVNNKQGGVMQPQKDW